MHSGSYIRNSVAVAEPGVDHMLRRFSSELKPHWPDAMRGSSHQERRAGLFLRTTAWRLRAMRADGCLYRDRVFPWRCERALGSRLAGDVAAIPDGLR